jgi:hypothetical protein
MPILGESGINLVDQICQVRIKMISCKSAEALHSQRIRLNDAYTRLENYLQEVIHEEAQALARQAMKRGK